MTTRLWAIANTLFCAALEAACVWNVATSVSRCRKQRDTAAMTFATGLWFSLLARSAQAGKRRYKFELWHSPRLSFRIRLWPKIGLEQAVDMPFERSL